LPVHAPRSMQTFFGTTARIREKGGEKKVEKEKEKERERGGKVTYSHLFFSVHSFIDSRVILPNWGLKKRSRKKEKGGEEKHALPLLYPSARRDTR